MDDSANPADNLRELLAQPDASAELAALLTANSGLPGPRANLALAATFAVQVAALGGDDPRWRLLREWAAIAPTEARTGDPREYLPFCAIQAFGVLYGDANEARREEIVSLLRAAAEDERWRIREAVAIALQRIAERNVEDIKAIIDAWLPTAALAGLRAIIAALAHPPILRDPATARYSLDIADQIMANMRTLAPSDRRSEEFRILRQGLEFALSVLVAALPDEGFARMRAWAAEDDPDVKRIVRANLGKARLKGKHADEVARVLAAL